MKIKISKAERAFDVFNVLFMFCMITICLYPFIYVLFGSLSNASELMRVRGLLWRPAGFSLDGYKEVLKNKDIYTGLGNSLYFILVGTTLSIVVGCLLAFVLSRPYLRYKSVIMKFMLVTMFFHGGLIPTFLVVKGIGLYDSRWSIILLTMLSTYNVIVLKSAFDGVPASIEESARIDGAGSMTVLWKLIVPLSKAAIAVQILFYAVATWNSWFNAMIYLKDRAKFPIQLILREILVDNQSSGASGAAIEDKVGFSDVIKYTTVIVTITPILCVYPFLQKHFVKGVMIGAVKG
ncbi:MAG: carbohydrate ABC transporter permease [Clostridia bacterium]|nr:carbohydrate ABC transporter permease [Clostridia bacterium]